VDGAEVQARSASAERSNPAAQTHLRDVAQGRVQLRRVAWHNPTTWCVTPNGAKPGPQSQVLGFFLALLGAVGGTGYIVLPVMLHVRGAFCPPTTFNSGSMASPTTLTVGVFLFIAAFIALVLLSNAFLAVGRRGTIGVTFVLAASGCSFVSANLWATYLESYYCVTPGTILLHPNIFKPSRTLTWNDVRSVQAECGFTKRTQWGRLTLSLSDGTKLGLMLDWHTAVEYDIIKTALVGKVYSYSVASTVTERICPPTAYPLLLNWEK